MLGELEFCGKHGCRDRQLTPFEHDRFAIDLALRRYKQDAQKMSGLRQLLNEEGGAPNVWRISNDDVIRRIADLVARERFHVHASPLHLAPTSGSQSQGSSAAPGTADQEPEPFRQAERQPVIAAESYSEPATDLERPTFPPNTDQAAQAALLQNAAGLGAPACYI